MPFKCDIFCEKSLFNHMFLHTFLNVLSSFFSPTDRECNVRAALPPTWLVVPVCAVILLASSILRNSGGPTKQAARAQISVEVFFFYGATELRIYITEIRHIKVQNKRTYIYSSLREIPQKTNIIYR